MSKNVSNIPDEIIKKICEYKVDFERNERKKNYVSEIKSLNKDISKSIKSMEEIYRMKKDCQSLIDSARIFQMELEDKKKKIKEKIFVIDAYLGIKPYITYFLINNYLDKNCYSKQFFEKYQKINYTGHTVIYSWSKNEILSFIEIGDFRDLCGLSLNYHGEIYKIINHLSTDKNSLNDLIEYIDNIQGDLGCLIYIHKNDLIYDEDYYRSLGFKVDKTDDNYLHN